MQSCGPVVVSAKVKVQLVFSVQIKSSLVFGVSAQFKLVLLLSTFVFCVLCVLFNLVIFDLLVLLALETCVFCRKPSSILLSTLLPNPPL